MALQDRVDPFGDTSPRALPSWVPQEKSSKGSRGSGRMRCQLPPWSSVSSPRHRRGGHNGSHAGAGSAWRKSSPALDRRREAAAWAGPTFCHRPKAVTSRPWPLLPGVKRPGQHKESDSGVPDSQSVLQAGSSPVAFSVQCLLTFQPIGDQVFRSLLPPVSSPGCFAPGNTGLLASPAMQQPHLASSRCPCPRNLSPGGSDVP